MELLNKQLQRLLWISLLLGIWQLAVSSGKFSEMILPSPRAVISTLAAALGSGDLVTHIIYSLSLIGQGLLIGFSLAFILALLAHISVIFASFLETIIAIAHPLPGIALMPLVLIWFGAGRMAVLVVIIHSVLWPLVLNLRTGFESVPKIYRLLGDNYQLNALQKTIKILLPASFPYLLSGFKIGWARAWRALISAEMLFGVTGSLGGLGWYIYKKRVFFDLAGVFAGIAVIVLIGILIEDLLFTRIERATVRKWGMQL